MPSIEFSSQLRQLYFEEQTLNRDLIQLMTEENNTRNRMEIVSTEINKLLRQKRKIDAPFVNVRRESQNEENISESCQLRKFYFENRVLSKFLRELMTQENNIRNRMVFVSTSINILLREMIAEQDEVKLKKNSCVKPIKELYSTMENCGICLEDHKYTDVCTLPCNHEYGTKCFENWYTKGSKTCPECRNPTKEIKTYRCVPIDTAKSRRDMEMVDNIIESSPILLQLYGEIKLLRRNLNEKIINANNTQKRLINILTEIDVLTPSPDFA
jgi:hypothetical protein